MASLNHLNIYLEFEPIVKVVCLNSNCKHNLLNATNVDGRQMAACNLKQITIDQGGSCSNFEQVKK